MLKQLAALLFLPRFIVSLTIDFYILLWQINVISLISVLLLLSTSQQTCQLKLSYCSLLKSQISA